MTLNEARVECRRWLAYLQRQKEHAVALQEIAGRQANGEIDAKEARRQLSRLDSGVSVYDGAELAKAVELILGAPYRSRGGAGAMDLEKLRGLHLRVNTLGGAPSDEYDQGYCDAIDTVLTILEETGFREGTAEAADEIERLRCATMSGAKLTGAVRGHDQ